MDEEVLDRPEESDGLEESEEPAEPEEPAFDSFELPPEEPASGAPPPSDEPFPSPDFPPESPPESLPESPPDALFSGAAASLSEEAASL